MNVPRTDANGFEDIATRRRLLPLLRRLLRPHRLVVAAIVVLIGLASLLEGVSFSLLVPLTQTFTGGAAPSGTAPSLLRAYDRWLAPYSPESRLALLGLALVGLFVLKNGVQFLREGLSTRLWLQIGVDARVAAFEGVLRRPYRYFLDRKQGTLVEHLYHEPHHVAYLVQMAIEQTANLLATLVLIGFLILVSWQVTALLVALGAVYAGAVWVLSKQAHTGGEARQEAESEAMALLTETVAGIRQVKVFSAESRIGQVYEGWVRRFRDLHLGHWLAVLLPHHVTELFWVGVLGLLLCLPALGLAGGVESVLPIVAVFAAVAFRIGPYVSRLSQGWLSAKFFLPALQVVGALMETPAADEPRRSSGRPFRGLAEAIQMERVTFAYGDGRPALSGVSVRFTCGETTAIIGPSGAGKSTLMDLLVGLYEPTVGRILVDGVDVREYDPASWLGAIGLVSQDTFIFHGTIRENIGFACPGATLEQIMTAAGQANAHDFIERCPDGYETVVGDRGLKLSGGERQRIAIARALVRNPQLLIFDEATSALDNQSEALVQEAIARIARDRTVIVIAHRLSTVIRADKIVVLVGGTIVEEGTHASLLKGGGTYSALYGRELAKESV